MSDPLVMYAVYDHPADFPDLFVVRRWSSGNPVDPLEPLDGPIVAQGPTLESVRRQLPAGLYNLGRFSADEPQLVEVWL